MYFLDASATGGAQGRVELVMGDLLAFHYVGIKFAVVNEDLRAAFDETFDGFAAVGEAANERVGENEGGGGNDPAGNRVVAAVHGVLDCVAQNQQQDQIKGSQLAYLALTRQTQQNEEENVNDEAAQNEFPPGKSRVPHGVPHEKGN